MYLLFTENKEENPPLGDGSLLALTECEEGWFCHEGAKSVVDELEWEYTEVESITPKVHEEI